MNCASARPRRARTDARAGSRARVRVTRIGSVRAVRKGTPRLLVRAPDGAALRVVRGGYDHFA